MKTVNEIVKGVEILEQKGAAKQAVFSVELDSRNCKTNSLFVAVPGTLVDGHTYINKAISLGATTIVCQTLPTQLDENILYIKVADSSLALGIIASNFYGNPSSKLKLVAVTGTNGKTSIATMLFQLFTKLGYTCGLLSTVENKIGNEIIPATHTTPHAVAINALLAQMVDKGCTYCFMEASSHAIHQNRLSGLALDGAIFTNLTHDHLDYHNTFKDYLIAKKALFDHLPKTAFALSNADDKNGQIMLQNTVAKKMYYAIKGVADFTGRILESDFNGTLVNFNGKELHIKLIGQFNVYNVLAVYGAALLLGQDETEVLIALSTIEGAEGRFETTVSAKDKIVAIVDYAHTPDALKKVLETIQQINAAGNQVITVVGCGGDRDKTKRPLMGAIAAKLSSKAILTSDNPRSENPATI